MKQRTSGKEDVQVEGAEIKKYELIDKRTEHDGMFFRRIRAIRDFGYVKAGDLGGFEETSEYFGLDQEVLSLHLRGATKQLGLEVPQTEAKTRRRVR